MKLSVIAGILLLTTLILGCPMEEEGRDGVVVRNTARLERAEASGPSASLQAPRSVTGTSVRSVSQDGDGKYRTTPDDLSGDLCYAILSLGDLGPGMFGMTWLAPESTFPDGPSSGVMSNVIFTLAAPTDISGYVVAPESADGMPSRQEIIRAELSFNYVDAVFSLGTPPIEYRIRTVYATTAEADDVSGTMRRGDKLIRLPDETVFKWASAAGLHDTRPETGAYQDSTVVDAVFPGDGNPDYVPVTANFPVPLPVTYALLTDPAKIWTLTFDLSDAILWGDTDPETLSSPEAIVAAFRLKFGPNQSTTYGEEDDGIQAALTIE